MIELILCVSSRDPQGPAQVPRTPDWSHPLGAHQRSHFFLFQHALRPCIAPTTYGVEMLFSAFWHRWTKGDVVLTALRAFKAAWLSEQMLTYFLKLNFIDARQDSIYLGLETVANFPREKLSLHPQDSSPGSCILDPSVYQTSPLTAGVPGPLVHSSLVSKVTLYLG